MLIIVLAIAATACGSNSGSKAAPPTTTSTKPSTDQRVIGAGLIRPSDLPGWVHGPKSDGPDPDPAQLARGVAGCENFVKVVRKGDHKRDSETFEHGDQQVSDTIEVYPSTAAISTQLELSRDPSTLSCERDLFRKLLTVRLHSTVDKLDVSPIAVNDLGDDEIAFRITASVNMAGQTIDLLTDEVGVQVGRFALSFGVYGTTSAQLAELETTLLPKLVERMKQAGA